MADLSSTIINSTFLLKHVTNFLDPIATTWEPSHQTCALFIGLWSALGRLSHCCTTHLYQFHTSEVRPSLAVWTKSFIATNQVRPSSKVKTPAAHRAVYSPSDKPAGCKLCFHNSRTTKWWQKFLSSPATAPGRSTASGRESRSFSRPASFCQTNQRLFSLVLPRGEWKNIQRQVRSKAVGKAGNLPAIPAINIAGWQTLAFFVKQRDEWIIMESSGQGSNAGLLQFFFWSI